MEDMKKLKVLRVAVPVVLGAIYLALYFVLPRWVMVLVILPAVAVIAIPYNRYMIRLVKKIRDEQQHLQAAGQQTKVIRQTYFPPKGKEAYRLMGRWMRIAGLWVFAAVALLIILGRGFALRPGPHVGGWFVAGLFACGFISYGVAIYHLFRYLRFYRRQE